MYLEFRILDDKKARATVRELRRIVTRRGPPAPAKRGKDGPRLSPRGPGVSG